jgi:hypothetical protein
VAKWTILTIFCVSLTGCCSLTPMPPAPPVVSHTRDPIVSYSRWNKTYTVTAEMVEEATMNKLYVREVGIWQRENKVR